MLVIRCWRYHDKIAGLQSKGENSERAVSESLPRLHKGNGNMNFQLWSISILTMEMWRVNEYWAQCFDKPCWQFYHGDWSKNHEKHHDNVDDCNANHDKHHDNVEDCNKNHENHHDNVGDKESETTIVKKPPNVDSSCSSVWPRIICDVVQWVVVVNVRSLIDNVGSCFSSVWWPRIIYHVVQWFMVVRWWWQFCQFLFSCVSPWTVGSQSPPCCPVSPSQPG